MTLPPRFLDELRDRTRLSELVGRTVRVSKAGREWKACCPFHDEKTPSFTINDEKGFYHCFGCGAHGDAIRWLTDHRGLGFLDAVKELAEAAGMEMPRPDPAAARAAEQRAGLHDVMAAAAEWFAGQLAGAAGVDARAYAARRGLDAAILSRFGFGFAPDRRDGIASALARFGPDMLVEAGLLVAVDGRAPYDRFRGRLMIPIRDARGRVIAFGGRVIGAGEPKYLNSPDTPLFDKGRTLFNLDRAAAAARARGRLLVVEGYMDVVALAAAGIEEAVAPLGTALTEQQVELLWRHCAEPVLCFDGDGAGQRAALRAATRTLPLLRPGHSLAFATLPAGSDPDDLVRSGGPAAIEAVVDRAEPMVERLWRAERESAACTTPEAKAGLKQRLMDHADAIAHPDVQRLYRQALRQRFDADFFPQREPAAQWSRRNNGQDRRPWRPTPTPVAVSPPDDLLARTALLALVREPSRARRHAEPLARLAERDDWIGGLSGCLLEQGEGREALDTARFAAICHRRGLGPALRSLQGTRQVPLLLNGDPPEPDTRIGDAALGEALAILVERRALDEALDIATKAFETDLSDGAFAVQQQLLQRKRGYERRLNQWACDLREQAVASKILPQKAVMSAGNELESPAGSKIGMM